MKSYKQGHRLITIAALLALAAIGTFTIEAEDGPQALLGRIVALGIPDASAISGVGTFLAGGPIHDKPAFAAFTLPGKILDPMRILVGSPSNLRGRSYRSIQAVPTRS
jgi:hypothetical protein